MATRTGNYPVGVEQAAASGTQGAKSPNALVTLQGVVLNPYAYGTPCFWVWYGADHAREALSAKV
jgi:hypothetical protein